jgi:glycine cleavage system H lipoate-binding protein
LLDEHVEITLPPPLARVDAGDPLASIQTSHGALIAWACAGGTVVERNERLAQDPAPLLADPERGGWLVRLSPAAWPLEARNFSWGRAARTSYAAQLARGAGGEDVFADLRAERLFAGPRVEGRIDIVDELRRRRAEPRFRSSGDVYAVCGEPVRERIARAHRASRLRRLEIAIRYRVTEPDAEMTLATGTAGVTFTCGPAAVEPDVTLTMSADMAAEHFGGRLDIARALRAGLVTSDRPRVETLRTLALLKPLLAQPASAKHGRR